jgi:hypothetical protein
MITKSYSGIIDAIDKNFIPKKVSFTITVNIGFLTFLFNWRQLSSYILDNVNQNVRAIVYGYDCEKVTGKLINEIEMSIKYAIKKDLAMYKNIELTNFQIFI